MFFVCTMYGAQIQREALWKIYFLSQPTLSIIPSQNLHTPSMVDSFQNDCHNILLSLYAYTACYLLLVQPSCIVYPTECSRSNILGLTRLVQKQSCSFYLGPLNACFGMFLFGNQPPGSEKSVETTWRDHIAALVDNKDELLGNRQHH